jgi:hypothetical protein
MLEEINRSVREMEEDERQLQHIRERDQRDESVPIEPGLSNEKESKLGKDNTKPGKPSVPDSDDDPPKSLSAAPDNEAALQRSDE